MATPPSDRQHTTQLRRPTPTTYYPDREEQTAPSPKTTGKSHLNPRPSTNALGAATQATHSTLRHQPYQINAAPRLQIQSNCPESTPEIRPCTEPTARSRPQRPNTESPPSIQPRRSNRPPDQHRPNTESPPSIQPRRSNWPPDQHRPNTATTSILLHSSTNQLLPAPSTAAAPIATNPAASTLCNPQNPNTVTASTPLHSSTNQLPPAPSTAAAPLGTTPASTLSNPQNPGSNNGVHPTKSQTHRAAPAPNIHNNLPRSQVANHAITNNRSCATTPTSTAPTHNSKKNHTTPYTIRGSSPRKGTLFLAL